MEGVEIDGLKVSALIKSGRKKSVYRVAEDPQQCLINIDDVTGDVRMISEGQKCAQTSIATTAAVFELLNYAGVRTHYLKLHHQNSILCHTCGMVPIRWVVTRVATAAFLSNNPCIPKGFRFSPPNVEKYFKDGTSQGQRWTDEQCLSADLKVGNNQIKENNLATMRRVAVAVFEILERCWAAQNSSLEALTLQFGMKSQSSKILVADFIDNDSWCLVKNEKGIQLDDLDSPLRGPNWVVKHVSQLSKRPKSRVVAVQGNMYSTKHTNKMKKTCQWLGIPYEMRFGSAHLRSATALEMLANYAGDGVPTVFIAVTRKSNTLGPFLAGHTTSPVINCPDNTGPLGPDDIWSSLRHQPCVPCTTVLDPDMAVHAAATMFGLSDHVLWSKLHAVNLYDWINQERDEQKATGLHIATNEKIKGKRKAGNKQNGNKHAGKKCKKNR